jgi:hypothetical protein
MPETLDQIMRFHNKRQSHVTLVVSLFLSLDHFDPHLEFAQIFWRRMMPELFQSTMAAERIPKRLSSRTSPQLRTKSGNSTSHS